MATGSAMLESHSALVEKRLFLVECIGHPSEGPGLSLTWEGWEGDMRRVHHYGTRKVMRYRPSLYVHSGRVWYLVSEWMLPWIKERFPDLYRKLRIPLIRAIVWHHDDPELQPLGDIPLQYKLMMTKKELKGLKQKEAEAIEAMVRCYRHANGKQRLVEGYPYRDVLFHAHRKDCTEAHLLSAADKLEAFSSGMHEALAGNGVFIEPVFNYCMHTFNRFPRKYPLIRKLFTCRKSLFSFPPCNLAGIFKDGSLPGGPHTRETIAWDTKIPPYEIWKQLTIKHFGEELLLRPVESFPPQA